VLGSTGDNKDALLEKCEDQIEVELELVGATAIEDKLQVDVGKIAEKNVYLIL